MSSNETNHTTDTSDYMKQFDKIVNTFYTLETIQAVVGTLLNVWFLVAILWSKDTRSRLRNKIICNSLVLNLLDSSIILPVQVENWKRNFNLYMGCIFYSVVRNLSLIQDFISNWLLVMLIVVFIAQIEDFNPRMKLTPRFVTIATIGLLVVPWVASLVVVPIIVHEFNIRHKYASAGCLFPTQYAMKIFRSVDTALPIVLAVLLVIVAAVLRYRKLHRGHSSSSMQIELIGRGPEIDNIFAYILAVAVSTACDGLRLLITLGALPYNKLGLWNWFYFMCARETMADARIILMPLAWLLLTDFRKQIITWRPWHRHVIGIDLTVAYRKE